MNLIGNVSASSGYDYLRTADIPNQIKALGSRIARGQARTKALARPVLIAALRRAQAAAIIIRSSLVGYLRGILA